MRVTLTQESHGISALTGSRFSAAPAVPILPWRR